MTRWVAFSHIWVSRFIDNSTGNIDVWVSAYVNNTWLYSPSFIPMLSSDYNRVSYTFSVPENAVSNMVSIYLNAGSAVGTAWIDCAQLEEGTVANRYNMLQNGDFTFNSGAHPTAWLANSSNASNDIVYYGCTGVKPEGLSTNTMRLYGTGRTKYAGIYQDIAVSGNQGDVYSAGGWSFNYSKPRKGEDFRYNIRVAFLKSGTSSTRENTPSIEWSEEWSDWQLAAGPVVAPCNYTSIRFNIDYERNINYAEFAGLFLHKEEFGKTFAYDENGNVLSTKNLAALQSHATYDDYNNLLTYRQPGRSTSDKYTMEYGSTTAEKKKHLLVKSSSPLDIQQAYTYDGKGNVLTQQTQNSTASTFIKGTTAYTADQNYVATQTDARGKVVTSNINPTTGTLTSVQDPNGQTVNYTYDSLKRVTGVQATANGKTYKNAYVYDGDKLTQVSHNTTSDANCDVQYNFAYDAAGRPTTVKVGAQTLSANTYNPDGTLNRVDYGNDDYVTYTYDDYKRLLGLRHKWDYEDRYVYSYGANGQVAQVQDNQLMRVVKSEYDTANRPMRITLTNSENGGHLYTGEVQYDEYNNLKQFKEKVGAGRAAYQTDFTYDKENKPTQMTFGDTNNKVAYTYDALGRVSTRTVTVGGVACASTYSYVAGGHGTGSTSALVGSISQGNYENCGYTYDNVGNIIAATRGDQTTTYAYDNLGQLIRTNDPFEDATWVYNYDRGGNMTSKVRYAYTTGALGTALQTISYGYDTTWKDKLASYNGQSITYDQIGNPLSDGTWSYTWNGRQMRCIHKGDFGSAGYDENTYDYNADGLRTKKTRMYADASGNIGYESTEYTLHGKNIVHVTSSGNTLHFWYDAQSRPTIVDFNGTKYAYIHNLQGDVVGLKNASGTEVVRYTYDSWGKLLSTSGSMASTLGHLNPFRYRGYVYDEETGLYYLQNRFYNPNWCRFINPDGVMGATGVPISHNGYSYCSNNPLRRKDVGGTFFFDIIFDVVSLVVSIVDVVANPTDPMAWAGLAGDVVDLVPGITGVGETVRAVNTGRKAADAVDSIVDGLKIADKALDTVDAVNDTAVDTYRALKKLNKGNGLEVHHIVEKRFIDVLDDHNPNNILSVALSKPNHRQYTNAWRKALPYGKSYSKEAVWEAAQSVYANDRILLDAAKTILKK